MVSSPQSQHMGMLAFNKEDLERHLNGADGVDRIQELGHLLDERYTPSTVNGDGTTADSNAISAGSSATVPSVSTAPSTFSISAKTHSAVPSTATVPTFIDIKKTTNYGFGFNIVGGVDAPHVPDDLGIFVSMIRVGGPADGLLKEGDKILAVGDKKLEYMSHDEAVRVFKEVPSNTSVCLLVETNAEARIMGESRTSSGFSFPRILSPVDGANSSASTQMDKTQRCVSTPNEQTPAVVATSDKYALTPNIKVAMPVQEEDGDESVTSYAPSMHSIIDDVPRTPKKPYSLLDPRNNSVFTEVLYASVGVAAICVAAFATYKFIQQRRS